MNFETRLLNCLISLQLCGSYQYKNTYTWPEISVLMSQSRFYFKEAIFIYVFEWQSGRKGETKKGLPFAALFSSPGILSRFPHVSGKDPNHSQGNCLESVLQWAASITGNNLTYDAITNSM